MVPDYTTQPFSKQSLGAARKVTLEPTLAITTVPIFGNFKAGSTFEIFLTFECVCGLPTFIEVEVDIAIRRGNLLSF